MSRSIESSDHAFQVITNSWERYSDSVADHFKESDYLLDKTTIPSPGNFIFELLNTFEEQNKDLHLSLYSDYPWKLKRENGDARTDFEKKASKILKIDPEIEEVHTLEKLDGHFIFKSVHPIIMRSSCVACHNNSPHSPKKDWRVGDVGGMMKFSRNLDSSYAIANQLFGRTFMLAGVRDIFVIGCIVLLLSRFRQVSRELEMQVKERTMTLADANADLEQRNVLIRQVFGRYLSDEIVENLLQSPHSLSLGGQRRRVTILTSDLRGFTAISEKLSAEEVISILNIYLERMADIINQYNGTINEIMGDGILVLFGAPTERDDDAEKAIACALAMQLAMTDVNQRLKRLGFPQLDMGIGINTGLVILGNIGSEKRTKYGVVGSQVNLTYRIESFSLGGQILLAESTFHECQSLIRVRGQKQVQAKGVKEAITIYELEGIAGSYNLFLPQQLESFKTLPEPIAVKYQVLEEKHLDLSLYSGQLTELSRKGAKIVLNFDNPTTKLTAFTNIKLNLCHLPAISEDIYAKVSEQESEPHSFYIHFTSKTAMLEKIIENNLSD